MYVDIFHVKLCIDLNLLCINLYANMQYINPHIYHLSMESSVYAFQIFITRASDSP